MQIWIGVENFAKIESAKICVNNFTILVGENNSGKTFLMQLVQGVANKIVNLIDETVIDELLVEENDLLKHYEINCDNVSNFVSCINNKLLLEKEKIVKEIFEKEIPIERLYIDISIEDDITYNLEITGAEFPRNIDVIKTKSVGTDIIQKIYQNIEDDAIVCIVDKRYKKTGEHQIIAGYISKIREKKILFQNGIRYIIAPQSLFLPASRTGLMLLYREFFANKADKELSFTMKDEYMIEDTERYSDLTKPVYEFLRFLQTYSEDEQIKMKYNKELQFFEQHLIEGHISVDKQGVFSYSSIDEENRVPMYLASSMINEVAPLVLAITSRNRYSRLIIDEAEASLHPQKQMELVRFFNRLNNKGLSIMVSTHSDTFASRLNNMYVLSEKVKKFGEGILKELNLEPEDLIKPERLFVYEVVNQPNGKSIVREMEANGETGYQFELFTDSAMKLYEEALKLGEI